VQKNSCTFTVNNYLNEYIDVEIYQVVYSLQVLRQKFCTHYLYLYVTCPAHFVRLDLIQVWKEWEL